MNVGHTFTIPAGDQIAAVMRQLWTEQYAVIEQALRLHGRRGLMLVDLDRWKPKLIERLLPLYQQLVVEGAISLEQHTIRKHIKRGAGIELIHGIPVKVGGPILPPTAEVNEYIAVTDPNVEELARRYLYDFAASTLATSKLNILEAYQQTGEVMAHGLAHGNTLDMLTQEIGRIFHDPYRANMIAASEASRLYHGGQLITASDSGEVEGKTWLASSDACEECLALNGKTVPLNEPFVDKPGRYGRVMHPPLHPFCMCSLLYEMLTQAEIASVARTQPVEEGQGLPMVPSSWAVFRQAA